MSVDQEESNLVSHARTELIRLGEDETTIEWYLSVVKAFTAFGHSGGSAMATIPVLHVLLQYENITPLTSDPDEWMHVAEEVWGETGGIWQSRRNPKAFSNDGGKTYYYVDDVAKVSKVSSWPFHLDEREDGE